MRNLTSMVVVWILLLPGVGESGEFCRLIPSEPIRQAHIRPIMPSSTPLAVMAMPEKVVPDPGENCYLFYFSGNYEHRGFVSPSMPTYLSFGQTGTIQGTYPPIYLLVDVPLSVQILGGRFLPGDRIVASPVMRDGQGYRRYRIDFTYGRYAHRASVSQLVVTTTLPPGAEVLAFYATEVAGKRVHEQRLPLASITIPEVSPPKRIPVFLDTFAGSLTAYPAGQTFRRLGFNVLGGLGGDPQGLARAAALMGMEAMDWNNEAAAGADDWRTLDRAGKAGDGICPTYRGPSLESWLKRGRDLIDAGIFTHVNDPERRDGEGICFHKRDLAGFRAYLQTPFPELLPEWGKGLDPHQQWPPLIIRAWEQFKAHEYADLMAWYAEQMRSYMRQKKLNQTFSWFLYANPIAGPPEIPKDCQGDGVAIAPGLLRTIRASLQDPRELAKAVAYYAPMIYLDVDGRRTRTVDMLTLQRQIQCYRAYYRGTMKLVPALSSGFPFTELASELPAEAMKYQVLEAFASGAQGIGIYHEGSFDALRMKHFAEAMRQVVRVEDVFADGLVIPETRLVDRNAQAYVKGVEAGRRAVILVSEYSQRRREAQVWYGGSRPAVVIDLKDGRRIASLHQAQEDFEVVLSPNDDRARLFLIASSDTRG